LAAIIPPTEPKLSSRGEDLELAQRRGVSVARFGRRIAARSEKVRRLVVQSKRLHGGNHRAATTTRYQQRLFSHLPR